MLSDAEHRRLVEIESSLRADDPRLARRLDRHQLPHHGWTVAAAFTALTSIEVTVAELLSGNVAAGVLGVTAFATTAGIWVSRRRRR